MHELVVVDPFGLDGRVYAKGEAITDTSLFEKIEVGFPNKTVRRPRDQDAASSTGARAAPANAQASGQES